MTELCKFDELRSKTEKQLRQIVIHALDLGIRDARRALMSTNTRTFAEDHYLDAKKAYTEASRLIPLIDAVPEQERRSWDAKLEYLGEMLEGLSVLGPTRTPTSDNIPVLARALWKARGCPEGSPEEDWFQAERAMKTQRESDAGYLVSCGCHGQPAAVVDFP